VGTFIFSVDLKRIFLQLTEESIYCHSLCGPSFGKFNLAVGDGDLINEEDKSDCYT
jgi:hypothetical protein